jgi:hypothetical protein
MAVPDILAGLASYVLCALLAVREERSRAWEQLRPVWNWNPETLHRKVRNRVIRMALFWPFLLPGRSAMRCGRAALAALDAYVDAGDPELAGRPAHDLRTEALHWPPGELSVQADWRDEVDGR